MQDAVTIEKPTVGESLSMPLLFRIRIMNGKEHPQTCRPICTTTRKNKQQLEQSDEAMIYD
jgi:hypothetical protein